MSFVWPAPTCRRMTSTTRNNGSVYLLIASSSRIPLASCVRPNKHMLRAFFAQLTVGGFQLRFEEKQVIVVGGSCLVAAVAYITVGDNGPAMLELFIVFRINEDGLIEEFRTYFDQHCVHDAFD